MQSYKVRRMLFKIISQTRVRYRDNELSTGRSGGIRGGDRLPWLPIEEDDNFEPLTSVDWQLHVYGRPTKKIRRLSDRSALPLHYTRWTGDMKKKGIKRNAAFLVRPDGHVGVAATTAKIRPIEEYVERFSLKMK
ncbi:hypothetical protein [Salinicoccus roseus]|uniref:hypothetical protein n=1 Tax=Salinicoccus roseus TaxID=45670 RepID=UPI0023013043|nr:hypothetical protein [Salinicoccus roseus]